MEQKNLEDSKRGLHHSLIESAFADGSRVPVIQFDYREIERYLDDPPPEEIQVAVECLAGIRGAHFIARYIVDGGTNERIARRARIISYEFERLKNTGVGPQTLTELAKSMGITPGRLSQIKEAEINVMPLIPTFDI